MKRDERKPDELKNSTLSQTNPAGSTERDPRGKTQGGTGSADVFSGLNKPLDEHMGMGSLGGQFDDERGGGTSGLQYREGESQLTGDAVSAQGDNLAADRFGTSDESTSQHKEASSGHSPESGRSQAK